MIKNGADVKDKGRSERHQMPEYLNYYDHVLSKHKFFIDDEISFADLMLYNELVENYLLKDDYSKYVHLQKWIETISAMEEVKECNTVLAGFLKQIGSTVNL